MKKPNRISKLGGVIIAMPTPLMENEDIDLPSLDKLVDYLIDEGANGIMVAGTMGEGTALDESQRQLLIEATVAHTAGRVPVLATVSDVSTRKSLQFATSIRNSGIDYIVCTTPFYYKFPDPESIIRHINAIADSVEVPLIFYNASGLTGNPVDVGIMEKILNIEKVVGIKDSSCNYGNFVELLRRYQDKHERPGTIMQGDEAVFDASLLMGADGVVSGGGSALMKTLIPLYQAGVSDDKGSAIALQRKFTKELLTLLGPNGSRDWLFNIKKRLVEMDIISHPYVTSPFLADGN